MLAFESFDGPHLWHIGRTLPQDAQKVRPARPQRVKGRGGTHLTSCGPFAPRRILANGKAPPVLPISEKLLLNVEDLNEARTPLADIFSILLEEIADQLHRLFRRGGGMDEMRRELREQTHPGIVGTQQNHSFLCLQRQRNF
jgi:hypothetical protein